MSVVIISPHRSFWRAIRLRQLRVLKHISILLIAFMWKNCKEPLLERKNQLPFILCTSPECDNVELTTEPLSVFEFLSSSAVLQLLPTAHFHILRNN